jgi:hypothetical protein
MTQYKNVVQSQTASFLEGYKGTKHKNFQISSEDKYVSAETPFVTGAMPAILPMQISTISSDPTKRVLFTLLINPEMWNHGKTNSYQTTYTRDGWAVQLWGPNQDTISSTGRTAALMTPTEGLDKLNQDISLGYLNLLSFVSAYRGNGYEFEDFLGVTNLTRVVKLVHGVRIHYDKDTYMGHFNNFTIDEDDEHPFLYNYNFEFIVSTLSDNEPEVRGHYKNVSEYGDLIAGTAADPDALILSADPYTKPTTGTMVAPRPEDRTTDRLWARVTGLPFSSAFSLGYTDGSVQRNISLRGLLLTKTWDPTRKKFK